MSKRSAAVAAATKLQQILTTAIDDSESEMSMSSSDDTESTLSEDDTVPKTSKKEEPPIKRARHSEPLPLKQAAVSMTKAKKSLSLLLTMPLDVIFEILGRLRLKDLVNVSCASKLFRETLLSSGAKALWKRALESAGAPECPRDLNEPRWAKLLLDKSCESCGRQEQKHHKVDFFLRRRICTACKKEHLLVKSKVAAAFPDCDDIVLSLIPYTNIGAWSRGATSTSKFYWTPDIIEMMRTVAHYKRKIYKRLPGAKKEMATFIAERTVLVEEIHSTGKDFNSWFNRIMAGSYGCH